MQQFEKKTQITQEFLQICCLTLLMKGLPLLRSIIINILSHPFSTPGHFSSHVFQPSHINHCLWNDLPPELHTISSPPPPSLPITRQHLHLPPLSVTPRTFHSKLKSHLFNLSYPDPSDHSPSPSQQHPP